jgi:hypothetical protein
MERRNAQPSLSDKKKPRNKEKEIKRRKKKQICQEKLIMCGKNKNNSNY